MRAPGKERWSHAGQTCPTVERAPALPAKLQHAVAHAQFELPSLHGHDVLSACTKIIILLTVLLGTHSVSSLAYLTYLDTYTRAANMLKKISWSWTASKKAAMLAESTPMRRLDFPYRAQSRSCRSAVLPSRSLHPNQSDMDCFFSFARIDSATFTLNCAHRPSVIARLLPNFTTRAMSQLRPLHSSLPRQQKNLTIRSQRSVRPWWQSGGGLNPSFNQPWLQPRHATHGVDC